MPVIAIEWALLSKKEITEEMNNLHLKRVLMKLFSTLVVITFFGVIQSGQAQNTSVACDQMDVIVNVGSYPTLLNLYHSGGYLTWPSSENVMEWLFTDQEGNVVHEETLVDYNFVSFEHNVPITDTLFVSVLLTNDSAIYNGNTVACLHEDYLTWELEELANGTLIGYWTLGGTIGVDVNETSNIGGALAGFTTPSKRLMSIVDVAGREVIPETNQLLFYIYDDGSVEKRFMLDRR